jgi:alpha-D-xyloside xylohydrolase
MNDAAWQTEIGGARVDVDPRRGDWVLTAPGAADVASAEGAAFPSAPFAVRGEHGWRALVSPDETEAEGERLTLRWNDGTVVAFDLTDPRALRLRATTAAADAVAISLTATADERFYGLGERFDRLNQRGAALELWVENRASGSGTYKPVPFLLSSRGYGVALLGSRRMHVRAAHATTPWLTSFVVESSELEAVVIPGAAPADALRVYTELVGRPRRPPAWAFGPWKSRDWRVQSQATVEEDLALQQEHGLPCTVALIDASWEAEEHTFEFDSKRYPDPEGMLARAADAGAKVVLWISPSMTYGSDAHREAAERGFLISTPGGEVYVHDLGNNPGWRGSGIDFTNPEAREWFKSRLRALLERGVGGFKTDFGEQIPEDAVFADGRTGREVHNLLPVLYNEAADEVAREFDAVLLARSAWTGSQAFSAIWAGDQSSDFNPWTGLPSVIVAGQAAGLSGFPYWGSDVGGYFGEPEPECFVRWAQFAALTPIMEVHGLGNREPWAFGDEALAIYRQYAELHTRLVPYSLAAAEEAAATGLPLMRAMALAFPDDPYLGERWVEYQYLYGPDLLVAPVYSWGRTRHVRFPAGRWTDFDDGTLVEGPAVAEIAAPLDKLPLYVRAGALLPLLESAATPLEEALALEAFPAPGAACERRLPDGTVLTLDADADGGVLDVSGPPRRYTLRLHGAALVEGEPAWTGDARIRFAFADDTRRTGSSRSPE